VLIMTFKEGESALVDQDISIAVTSVESNQVTITVTGLDENFLAEVHHLAEGETVDIRSGVKVTPVRISRHRVRLGFEAPPQVDVRRAALVVKKKIVRRTTQPPGHPRRQRLSKPHPIRS